MQTPLEIDFRNVPFSEAIDDKIRRRAAKLEQICARLTACQVVIEAPHKHHRHGNAWQVHIRLVVPGIVIAVSRDHQEEAHQDLYVAVRDAFDAAQRQLEDYVRARDDVRRGTEAVADHG